MLKPTEIPPLAPPATKAKTKLDEEDMDDIFASFANVTGETDEIFTPDVVHFGPLTVTSAEKEGASLMFMADQFFSSGLVLAEMVELGRIPAAGKTMVEYGCGAGIPSLLASSLPSPPKSVLLTDYPDPSITNNLARNVERNKGLVRPGCKLEWQGFEWGTDSSKLLATLDEPEKRFDIILLADLLWLTVSLPALLETLVETLSHEPGSKIYVAAGSYTTDKVCDAFFASAAERGLVSEKIELANDWEGELIVSNLVGPGTEGWREGMAERKRRVKVFTMEWRRDA